MNNATKISGWVGLIAAILSVTGSIVGGTLWVSRRFTTQDDRMAKMESAIRVLNTELPKQQQLVRELLAAQTPVVHHFGQAGVVSVEGYSSSAPALKARAEEPKT